jgi:hypothetical protein
MAKKKRNHFLPRVILNRFSSWRDLKKRKYKTWSYQVDGYVSEISTKDIALEKYFYGKENSILEDRFSEVESKLGTVLTAIDQGASLVENSNFLSKYAWIQTIRTRSFRDVFTQTLSEFLKNSAKSTQSEQARKRFIETGRKLLAEEFKKLTPWQMEYARKVLGGTDVHEFADRYLIEMVNSGTVGDQMRQGLEYLTTSPAFKTGLASGHNEALLKTLETTTPLAVFQNCIWTAHECSEDTFILGDSCIFVIDKDGNFRSMGDFDNWARICFPISPFKCLIGSREDLKETLSPEKINMGSASCSLRAFFASQDRQYFRNLIPLINSERKILSDNEKEGLFSATWNEG